PKEAVTGLVALMARAGERSRLSVAANKALFSITGMELPDDADQWKAWFASHDGFEVPKEPPVAPPAAGRTVAKVFGLKLEFVRAADILRETALRNRFRRIAIKTISIGGESGFLRDLAAQNGGAYVRR